ncbi:hypothetical protein CP10881SC42_0099 [Chlamydia avium]|uniref:Uncharacterized protein n=1 Tax=Chlamydia avium TaxID=1457141 RepID=A0ABP2X838_9CHLA|nr:hypothetical protein CP10743SC13_0011 [Chlamydia psittaci 10_743_SC13]EPP38872.1 hypothetical protein CP10881SC42_0099 [Chlamydia avium]
MGKMPIEIKQLLNFSKKYNMLSPLVGYSLFIFLRKVSSLSTGFFL